MTSNPATIEDFPVTPAELYTRFYKPKSILKHRSETSKTEPTKRKVKKKLSPPKVAFDTGSEDEAPYETQVIFYDFLCGAFFAEMQIIVIYVVLFNLSICLTVYNMWNS